jgi:hypothetical protein
MVAGLCWASVNERLSWYRFGVVLVQRRYGREVGVGGRVFGPRLEPWRTCVARCRLPMSGGGRVSGSGHVSDGGRHGPDVR